MVPIVPERAMIGNRCGQIKETSLAGMTRNDVKHPCVADGGGLELHNVSGTFTRNPDKENDHVQYLWLQRQEETSTQEVTFTGFLRLSRALASAGALAVFRASLRPVFSRSPPLTSTPIRPNNCLR
jgi:hypothetical protein